MQEVVSTQTVTAGQPFWKEGHCPVRDMSDNVYTAAEGDRTLRTALRCSTPAATDVCWDHFSPGGRRYRMTEVRRLEPSEVQARR